MYSSARSVLYLSTMKPHDPKDEDDEADDCPPLPVVAQDGKPRKRTHDGKPQGSPLQNVPGLVVFIVVLLLVRGLVWLIG